MSNRGPTLPVLCRQPPAQSQAFAVGEQVLLKAAPFGLPGQVVEIRRGGRILVRWDDLGYVGTHRADQLIAASPALAQECPAMAPQTLQGASPGTE